MEDVMLKKASYTTNQLVMEMQRQKSLKEGTCTRTMLTQMGRIIEFIAF
jgi:hypothetical protein